jgi:hypothetical protein
MKKISSMDLQPMELLELGTIAALNFSKIIQKATNSN